MAGTHPGGDSLLPMIWIGWIATAYVLLAYACSSRSTNLVPFHYANVIGGVALGFANAALGAWYAVLLNGAFGAIAAVALWRHYGHNTHA